ncbi:MAG: 50S ribosomal protein L10, partial [Bacteroidaceae bacterium]|nr:50S ribosomal protein L10 [Bacteroidaceae bacterium]
MKKEDKALLIDSLVEKLNTYPHFYVVDVTALDSQTTSDLRRACFKNDIKLQVVKNTLFIKALEKVGNADFEALKPILKNTTGIMFCQVANQPAKLIKSFAKDHG